MRQTPLRPVQGSGAAHVVVIGGGMVGLSTAWFLQERGVEVTVVERSSIAAGSSWGNAGWISPGLCVPLSDPSVLKYGLKAVLDPNSPLFVPLTPDRHLASFMLGFARRCTPGQWKRTMDKFVPVNRLAISAYDELETGGVQAVSHDAPIMAAFRRAADAAGLEHEIELIHEAGLELEATEVDNATLRAELPIVSADVERAIRLGGQRYIDPGAYVEALASAVEQRGGRMVIGSNARALRHGPHGVTVEMVSGEPISGDAVVIATGAWLPTLAKPCGVRVPLRAGRGYSFSVAVTEASARPVPCPVYFPYERVACTPYGDRLRVGGTMEFAGTEDPLNPDRVDAIVRSATPLLSGVDWDDPRDVWVGSRPVTVDGLPLIGATKVPNVYVNGGHGMWGITLGPLSGKLLAEQMVTGVVPEQLRPFNPTR
ncbi:FAD-dependent oxidoreductase [Calidifontibacter sp. DB0510]|uniref:FAD-dependent oxidoreductase n=1 Tax=Metallococcus carri TaxID=1656884 RepID=A0A967B3Y4_9MICO|nr:FAD-dependent oxidoreductase [Metallococcus carri]NHN56830.1 FAD-dependent oxidoreductase [Metallococcus carri]NOP37793.1 FAD-dependent oxidoreductase [Calidifontibacter sp. DB2511S]